MNKKYSEEELIWYRRYYGIRSRCRNKKDPYYGGKGIECRFRDFQEFYSHIKSLTGFDSRATIDRVDSDKHYEVGNIRFASDTDQARNRKSTLWVEYDGRKMSFAEFREKYTELQMKTAWNYFKRGMPLEEIVKRKAPGKRGTPEWDRELENRTYNDVSKLREAGHE